jgi:hypothetical protein
MNSKDRNNLKFLMSLDDEEFDNWMEEAKPDDIEYALEIIRSSRSELIVQEMELKELQDINLTEVKKLLERIKKNV